MAQHQYCKRSSLCLKIKITDCCENIAGYTCTQELDNIIFNSLFVIMKLTRNLSKMVLKTSDVNLLLGNYHLYWKVYAVAANFKFH